MSVCSFAQALVEGGQSAAADTGEVSEVGIGDLPMADDAVERHGVEGGLVGPELVTRLGHERRQHGDSCLCRLALTNE